MNYSATYFLFFIYLLLKSKLLLINF